MEIRESRKRGGDVGRPRLQGDGVNPDVRVVAVGAGVAVMFVMLVAVELACGDALRDLYLFGP